MKPNEYEFWRGMLLGKGFKEPFFHNYRDFDRLHPFQPMVGMYVFALACDRGYYAVAVCEEDLNQKRIPKILMYRQIDKDIQRVWAVERDVENIEQVIDAVVNPELLPLCMGIHWAAPLVEFLFKEIK